MMGGSELLVYALCGTLTGMLGALLGLGGGVFLVPLLALGFDLPPRTAVAASLMAVIASSATATTLNMRRGLVNVSLAFTLLLATSTGGFLGGTIAQYISTRTLYAIFSSTLFVIAIIVTSRSRSRNVHKDAALKVGWLGGRVVEEGQTLSYLMKRLPLAMVVALAAGAISGLLGVGGGVVLVPVLNAFCGIPIRVAAATSAFMVGPTAAVSAFLYVARGDMDPFITAAIALGSLPGSAFGAWLSKHMPVRSIKGILATSLVLVALRLSVAAFGM
jgi:uncharacterized membrane protein YfcA